MQLDWKKNTALFLTSQTISLFGTMLVQYSIMWHIVLETQSSSILTIYVIVGVLPTFFTSLIGGVFADKYSKKALINISDGTIALVSLFIAISLSLGIDSIVLLLIAAGIRAFFQGIQQPTVNSLIPLIVPEEQLLRINGINSSIQSGIFMLSPIVAASLMSFTPLQTLFYIDVITASIAIIILIYLVRVPKNSKNDKEDTVKAHFAEMLDGIKYIRNHRFLLSLIIFQILFSISLTPAGILSVLQITKKFGPEVWRLSVFEIVYGGGMMIGGFMVGIKSFKNKMYSIIMAGIVCGIVSISFGLWTSFVLYMATTVIWGFFGSYYTAPFMTLVQEKVNPEFLGRTISVFTMSMSIGMPLGMLFFGPLAEIVSIDSILIVSGIVMVLLAASMLFIKEFRHNG